MSSVSLSHIEPQDAMKLFGKVNANTLTIEARQTGPIGIGLYPYGSMANHSDTCASLGVKSYCSRVSVSDSKMVSS